MFTLMIIGFMLALVAIGQVARYGLKLMKYDPDEDKDDPATRSW